MKERWWLKIRANVKKNKHFLLLNIKKRNKLVARIKDDSLIQCSFISFLTPLCYPKDTFPHKNLYLFKKP